MLIIAAILAGTLPLTVFLLLRYHGEQAAQWALERRELLNRIQRPDHVPLAAPEGFEAPEPEPDDTGLVGTLHLDVQNYLKDEVS